MTKEVDEHTQRILSLEPWIQTYTGKQFWLTKPVVEAVDIVDIAHALSNMCRFTGHTSRFYSVAQHSLACSFLVTLGYELYALLHDAHEAYVTDLASPIKTLFPKYMEIENSVQEVVLARFGLSLPMPEPVAEVDHRMLATEKNALLTESPADWGALLEPFDDLVIPYMDPFEAESKFLDRFNELYYGDFSE